MSIIAARLYISPRTRALTAEEAETRRLSYAIKDRRSSTADFATAGLEMARLISGPCWLVPIPSRSGDTVANGILCMQIASFLQGARMAKAIVRTSPIESQCARHRSAMGAIRPADHHFKRSAKFLEAMPVFLVDNVTTSGNTLQAAHDALGFGTGLVFADAACHRVQMQTDLFLQETATPYVTL
jgi:hypothetical protein